MLSPHHDLSMGATVFNKTIHSGHWSNRWGTYKTKLKLDREVGGGDFSDLCTVTYLITYPYGWTVNFEIWNLRFKHRGTKYGMLLTTHQPPIAKASQTSAWSHRYIGNWVGKTEGSPIGFIPIFWRLKSWKIPLAKVVDFEPLGAFLVSEDSRPIWLRSDGLTDDVWPHILHTCTTTTKPM